MVARNWDVYIDIFQASSVDDVRSEIDRHIECIVDALTLPADRLSTRAIIEPTMDALPPSGDGLLSEDRKEQLVEAFRTHPAWQEEILSNEDT